MSDGLTSAPTRQPAHLAPKRARPDWQVAAAQALVVLALFAATGAAAGWLWHRLWDAPVGLVAGGTWYTDESGLREDFSGVGLYVAIAALTGLLLGSLAAWRLDRSELVTLAAVLVGSVLAGYLMLRVGEQLGPPDPQEVAETAADGTRVEGALRVGSWPPRTAFPFGALLGVLLVYAGSVSRAPAEVPRAPSHRAAPPQH